MAYAENGFDDDFADLLDEDFDELERIAVRSTQAVQQSGQQINSVAYGGHDTIGDDANQEYADDDGGDIVVDESRGAYFKTPVRAARQLAGVLGSTNNFWQTETRADHAFETPKSADNTNIPYRPSSQRRESGERINGGTTIVATETGDEPDIPALQAQIKDLLSEREELQLTMRDANRQIFTKSGEISIVRANSEQALRDRDKRIADLERDLKASNDQRIAEQEQARKQQEQLATENRFADHDKVVNRARTRKQPRQDQDIIVAARPSRARTTNIQTTPKKTRHTLAGDGFNTEERSPVPSLPQSRDATPTAAEKKRKRSLDSPTKYHTTGDEDDEGHMLLLQGNTGVSNASFEITAPAAHIESPHVMMQIFLNHQYDGHQTRTIEIMSDFHLPSDKETRLSSLIYDALAKLDSNQPETSFAAGMCSVVLTLWQKCVSEKFYSPIKYFIDLIGFLLFKFSDAVHTLTDELVPLLQTTGDVNIVPRFKRHRRGATTQGPDLQISQDISVVACLDLLLRIVSGLDSWDVGSCGRFWRLIRFDFISILLRSSQDPSDIAFMARLLGYSARADSIGCIIDVTRANHSQGQSNFDQAKSEEHLLDRISSMLVETPKSIDGGPEEYSEQTVCDMRLALLNCLASYANRPYTANCIAQHPLVIGRLVRCMAEGYHAAMQSSPNDDEVLKSHLAIVSEATRLLYYFLDAFKSISINEKLARIPGGPEQYLVALSRVVFSEGNLYGVEIEEGVIDCAQSLLENYVSPEEADMLMEMASADQ